MARRYERMMRDTGNPTVFSKARAKIISYEQGWCDMHNAYCFEHEMPGYWLKNERSWKNYRRTQYRQRTDE